MASEIVLLLGAGIAVIIFTVLIRQWRLHGGYDHLAGDVCWGGLSALACFGWLAPTDSRFLLGVFGVAATAGLWLLAVARTRRKSKRRSSLARYYSN